MTELERVAEWPHELDDWTVVRRTRDQTSSGFVVWLERVLHDGTTLRVEATIHDMETELPMLAAMLVAAVDGSAPDLRLSVTRTKTTTFERLRSGSGLPEMKFPKLIG